MAVSAPRSDANTNAAPALMQAVAAPAPRERYVPPTYEVICLACEISSYAPDGDDSPLF